MLIHLHSAAINGLSATLIQVEVHTSKGTQFFLVGLPDSAVKESRNRFTSAIRNSGYQLPIMNTTINMAPADLKKEGTGYDLPLAMGMLAASGIVQSEKLKRYVFVGELGLDGTLRSIKGALSIAIAVSKGNFDGLILPKENECEAGVVNHLNVYGVTHLKEVVEFINGQRELTPTSIDTTQTFYDQQSSFSFDFSEVKGQENVKRAFEVAAAGGHNILLIGSPGCGKSMMSKRLPSILPPLSIKESLETTQIHSIAGKLGNKTSLITQRPFRSPHHSISDVALIGGGTHLQPGEISLAHNGVLFLDELPEFSKSVLETLRQPLEDRIISISRAKYTATLPCSFMLVASMNPCPCGYYNDPTPNKDGTRKCKCNPSERHRYIHKLSGPLLDRIDIQMEIAPISFDALATNQKGEGSKEIRERVIQARAIQEKRFKENPTIHCNAQMSESMVQEFIKSNAEGIALLRRAMDSYNLSGRAYNRILKVARTIADLEGSPTINQFHIAEAIGYRNLDREDWADRSI